MELLDAEPPIDLYDPGWHIHTLADPLPPARLLSAANSHSYVSNSMLAGGTLIRGASVTNSVLASNARVDEGSVLDEAVVLPNARIGANCRLRRVIVDSGAEIPDGTVVGWMPAERLGPMGHRVVLLTADSIADTLRSVA